MRSAAIPKEVLDFVEAVDSTVRDACADRTVSTYVHGSLALGGFNALVSDVDVLVVVDDPPLDRATLEVLSDRLVTMPCEGRGLELSVVTASAARRPSPPWPFLLHVATAPGDTKVIVGGGNGGDPDLLMHYTVLRAAGITVHGDPPSVAIGRVDRHIVLRYLVDELDWAQTHAGEAYGVLNAARAGCFLRDGEVVSKICGGQRVLASGGPADLLRRAIDVQHGRIDDRPPTDAALRFMRSTQFELAAGAET